LKIAVGPGNSELRMKRISCFFNALSYVANTYEESAARLNHALSSVDGTI